MGIKPNHRAQAALSTLAFSEETLDNARTQERWLDWYEKFGEEVGDLRNPKLFITDNNHFLIGGLDKVDVIENSIQEQTLSLHLKQRFSMIT